MGRASFREREGGGTGAVQESPPAQISQYEHEQAIADLGKRYELQLLGVRKRLGDDLSLPIDDEGNLVGASKAAPKAAAPEPKLAADEPKAAAKTKSKPKSRKTRG